MSLPAIIPPGSTIGILGGGQLGRMLAIAAAQLGYRAHVYSPDASGPASEVAAVWMQGAYDNLDRLGRFAAAVDVVTYEFENVDPAAVHALGPAVRPSGHSLEVSRYRPNEKNAVARLGGRTAAWRGVDSPEAIRRALAEIGGPAILKTSALGYDGKGQARVSHPDEADAAWAAIGEPTGDYPAILERRVDFDAEFSVVLARSLTGEIAVYDTPENAHRDGILATSMVPASALVLAQAPEAVALARAVAGSLGHVGVLTCEFFATADGPVFNEMAPRVHNSGHWTIEGATCSQFENHIRAICGLPLGATQLTGARVTMANLLGDAAEGWPALLAEPGAHLHLYGKRETKPGRKMGHVTRVER